MRTFTIFGLSLALLLVGIASCSDDDDKTREDSGVVLKRYGDSCTSDAECATGMCQVKTCTKACQKQADCPSVASKDFDCGEVAGGKLACYVRKYETKKKGTMGHNCSVDKCASGYLCTGQAGDADRYCAASCTADMDCPPRYRCVTTQLGKKAADKKSFCRLRQFCHPCVLDAQCGGVGTRCLKDKNGAGFCSKECKPATAPTSDAGPTGTCPVYAKCEKEGSSYYCKHKAGACFKSFKDDGAQCDPCIVHGWLPTSDYKDPVNTVAEANQCKKGGYCVLYNRYTGESGCLMPCDSSDKCPSSSELCFKFSTSLGGSFCMNWIYTDYNGTKVQTRGPCYK